MEKSIILNDFYSWLDKHLNFEKTPQKNMLWLETMNFLCEQLRHPERTYKTIHVAGSKGKGSISTMISSILNAAGIKTGLYTSPHILDFKERITLSNKFFPTEVYEKAALELRQTVESIDFQNLVQRKLTWFELTTAYAMLCFKIAKCEFAVFEVGLGGRLDATNVILPECCCITTIEKEHTEFLGDTIEKIAFEKAGIIKEKIPVIVSKQQESAFKVIKEIATVHNCKLLTIDSMVKISDVVYKNKQLDNFPHYTMNFSLKSPILKRDIHLQLKLLGEFQAQNAAVSVLAVKSVFPNLPKNYIEIGLNNCSLQGRFELIHAPKFAKNIPFIVLDGAHTVNSLKFTQETFFKCTKDKKAHLLFACAADKNVEEMAKIISKENFLKITLTKPGYEKKSDVPRMELAFSESKIQFSLIEDCKTAILHSISEAEKEKAPLLIVGSFYLLAEVKSLMASRKTRFR